MIKQCHFVLYAEQRRITDSRKNYIPSSETLLDNAFKENNILASPTSPKEQTNCDDNQTDQPVDDDRPIANKESNGQDAPEVKHVHLDETNHEDVNCVCSTEQNKCNDIGRGFETPFQQNECTISGLDYAGLKPLQHKAVLALKCESRREVWENR